MDFKKELQEYVKQFKESGETLYRWRKGCGYPFELDPLDAEELIVFLDEVDDFLANVKGMDRLRQARQKLIGE